MSLLKGKFANSIVPLHTLLEPEYSATIIVYVLNFYLEEKRKAKNKYLIAITIKIGNRNLTMPTF